VTTAKVAAEHSALSTRAALASVALAVVLLVVLMPSNKHGGGDTGVDTSSAALGLAGQNGATGTQNRHAAFLSGPVGRRTVAPDRVMPPASPYILQAGAVIPAALITGIRSDLPGQITAQVTENVYDSPTGNLLLIPQGTRIIG